MKKTTVLALVLCLVFALVGGTFAIAQEISEGENSADVSAEISAEDATATDETVTLTESEDATAADETVTLTESEDVPATEQPITDAYSPDRVVLTSSAWDESLGECVTGEFDTVADALLAVNSDIPLYYPSWDAGHLDTFGGAMIVILHNPVSVLDMSTGTSTVHASLQFNYHTPQLEYFKIHFGYTDKGAPEGACEAYAFGEYTFYLSMYEDITSGKQCCIAYATIEGCGYQFVARSVEDAKRIIDSLVRA